MNDKRKEAIELLEPIATPLKIKIDYVIDEANRREYLVCDNQKICTNDTSIYGIREEFFGYVFLREWRERSLGAFEKATKNRIRRYWYDKDFNQPYLRRG